MSIIQKLTIAIGQVELPFQISRIYIEDRVEFGEVYYRITLYEKTHGFGFIKYESKFSLELVEYTKPELLKNMLEETFTHIHYNHYKYD